MRKTSLRSCLQRQTTDDLMRVSVNGPSLNNLSPYRGLELWWAAAQKRMHVHGNKGGELKRGAQIYVAI